MGEDEAAAGIVVLHVEDAVETDAGAGLEPGTQALEARVPDLVAESAAAEFGPHDEEAHEAEFAGVAGDGAAADQLVAEISGDEGVGVGGPEQLGVVQAGVPAFSCGPLHQLANLGVAHLADAELSGHGKALRGGASVAAGQCVSPTRASICCCRSSSSWR